MKQGQFQALHALRVQKGFKDCKTENGACELCPYSQKLLYLTAEHCVAALRLYAAAFRRQKDRSRARMNCV